MNHDDDPRLTALALAELVARLGGPDALAEYCALVGGGCEHQYAALHLAGMIVSISETTGFPLQHLIDQERAEALAPDEPPPPSGMV